MRVFIHIFLLEWRQWWFLNVLIKLPHDVIFLSDPCDFLNLQYARYKW
jgi:hypothetical protein